MKRVIKLASIVVVLVFGFFILILSSHFGGWRAFVVLSPSMEPTFNTGSLVITQKINPAKLEVGDIITFINPTKTNEFVTHRIVYLKQETKLTIIKTKGDNNKAQDTWVVAGGGVVGKVIYFVPLLGYILSLTKTKIGIVIFILIPSIYILIDEIINIYHILTNWRKKKTTPIKLVIIFSLIFSGIFLSSNQPTQALLSDSVTLKQNSIKVISRKCNGGENIAINENTGSNSQNIAEVINSEDISVNQSSNTTIINNIIINSTTGNTLSNNSNDTQINTGESNTNITVTNQTSLNSTELTNNIQSSETQLTSSQNASSDFKDQFPPTPGQ